VSQRHRNVIRSLNKVSLALFTSTLALTAISYFVGMTARLGNQSMLSFERGELFLTRSPERLPLRTLMHELTTPDEPDFYFLGFSFKRLAKNTQRGWQIGLSGWILTASGLVLPAWKLLRRLRTAAPGLCTKCGYDLRATPDRCPECGAIPRSARLPSAIDLRATRKL